ncbi:InlB B-repeat-containing protein, partial [Candidatus Saccharibacteria bacterium]|nr:InlB B-repeat-containing protein [Candidatus Saccharibacteria bacterium]
DITIAAGETITLPQNTYTRTGSVFTNWNTVAEPTEQDPGEDYEDQADFTAPSESADITLYAQWAYTTTITFNGNGADSGSMSDQTIVAGAPQNLTPNAYAKDGYIFNGWNTVQTPTPENPGTAYADKTQYNASTTQPENITLYAQWTQPTMQNVALWGSTLSQGDTMQVPDIRDGKSYWVAKLADGNIWMTQNLDLDIDSTKTYTPADTDIPANWTPVRSTTNSTTWDTSTTGRTVPHSYDPGNLYWNGNVTTSGGSLSDRTTTDPSATSGGTHYHVGNYYNWTAAVAINDSSSYTTQYTDVNQSICPAGWRLPTYSGDKSYLNLKDTQGLTAGTSGNIQNSPVYFVYGGYWRGSWSVVGSGGRYWSSVVKGSSGSYRLGFDANGYLNPQSYDGRDYGYSLRCVAR